MAPNDNLDVSIDVDGLRRKYAEERAKRLQTSQANTDPEPELKNKFADFDRDREADPNLMRPAVTEETEVLIVGGGIAGLLTGGRLRESGIRDIRIIEKARDFGGTWYWNRYPGAACDVESYIYLPMLEEIGFMPSERYAKAPEIHGYLKEFARRFNLYPGALFQTLVTEMRWNEEGSRWIVHTNRSDVITAHFVVLCTGPLSNPKLPKIPGIETFRGHSFHTSRWDYAYTGGDHNGNLKGLKDKAIGIIGTGCTAIQAIPPLAQSAKHLYVFQRTPSSVDERGNRPTDPDWFKALKPGWQRERQENFASIISGGQEPVDLVQDGWTDIVRHVSGLTSDGSNLSNPEHMEIAGLKKMELVRRRIERTVKDKVAADALKPYFHYFCKRPAFHDEYLEAFNQPNVTLVDTEGQGVERITSAGVIVKGKEYPVDCLIYATGFDYLMEYAREAGFDVYGRNGIALSEHWKQGPRTLLGMQTDRFPNLFFIRLAQAANPANYTQTAQEMSSTIAHIIGQCVSLGAATVEATREAVDDWVEQIISKSAPRRAFLSACTPGQYNYEGNPQRERFLSLNEMYGGGAMEFFRILRSLRAAAELQGLHFGTAKT